jgi:hypothetical protein
MYAQCVTARGRFLVRTLVARAVGPRTHPNLTAMAAIDQLKSSEDTLENLTPFGASRAPPGTSEVSPRARGGHQI